MRLRCLGSAVALTLLTGCISQSVFVVIDSQQHVGLTRAQLEQVQHAVNAALESLPSGEIHRWAGQSNVGGKITPIRTFKVEGSGRYCREFDSALYDTRAKAWIDEGRYIACRIGPRNWPVCDQPGSDCG